MKNIILSLRVLVFFTILTGFIYPLGMTVLSKVFFSNQAAGSLIEKNGKVVGSTLIAQKFLDPKFFWPRPSAGDFNGNPSGASNLGPTSNDLKKQISDRRDALVKSLAVDPSQIPQDLITTSASGLDPHISPEGAKVQVMRLAKARNWPQSSLNKLNDLIDSMTEKPDQAIFGERRVNVLKLNLALDDLNKGL